MMRTRPRSPRAVCDWTAGVYMKYRNPLQQLHPEGIHMLRFLPYVLKTLWRHRTRTLLTVSGTAVALLVFSFVTAVQEGLARLLSDQQHERTLIVFQANRFCPSTS